MQTILVLLVPSFVPTPPTAMKMLDVPIAALDPATPGAAVRATVDSPATIALSQLDVGAFATIHAVRPADEAVDRAAAGDLLMRLVEIGFVPGERVRVIAVGHPGRQPIAVRLAATDSGRRNLNGATFALRRHEADLIRVVPDPTQG